jgi:flagellar basal body rod protein FlgB
MSGAFINLSKQRLAYLNHAINLHTRNISVSDIPNETGKEMKAFKNLLNLNKQETALALDKPAGKNLLYDTKRSIKREEEVMRMNEAAYEYQGILSLIKKQLNLLKATMPR